MKTYKKLLGAQLKQQNHGNTLEDAWWNGYVLWTGQGEDQQ